MFKKHGSNQHQINYQKIATRFYLLFLLILLIVFSFYLLLNEDLQQTTIHQPLEFQYKQLEELYSSNLYCPCSTVSMSYSTFMTIEPYFHQVCSSGMITDAWINYTRSTDGITPLYAMFDYRVSAVFLFQLLSMFCQHAQQTVNISIRTFLQTQFLSSQVISNDRFETKVNSSISDLKSQSIDQFLQTVKIFQGVSHGNQLMSEQFHYYIPRMNWNDTKMILEIQEYFNCSCSLSSSCLIPMGFFDASIYSEEIYETIQIVPNLFLGCSQIEGLMKSSLECFYNLSCVNEVNKNSRHPADYFFNFSNLNENLNLPNETIESIMNRLMVDSWKWNISFSSYYNRCSPSSCTYEYISRNDLFFVITTIIGIFGGLSLGLKLLNLVILRFI
ncbi:unnamed protein product, partial [Rotaria sp. Silwood1]